MQAVRSVLLASVCRGMSCEGEREITAFSLSLSRWLSLTPPQPLQFQVVVVEPLHIRLTGIRNLDTNLLFFLSFFFHRFLSPLTLLFIYLYFFFLFTMKFGHTSFPLRFCYRLSMLVILIYPSWN